jgi:hypothetical protein
MKISEIPLGVKISIGFFLFMILVLVFNLWIKPLLGM